MTEWEDIADLKLCQRLLLVNDISYWVFQVLQHHTPSPKRPSQGLSGANLCPSSISQHTTPQPTPTATCRPSLLLLLQSWWLFFLFACSCQSRCRLCRESSQQSLCSLLLLGGSMLVSSVSSILLRAHGNWHSSFQMPPPFSLPRELPVLLGQVV